MICWTHPIMRRPKKGKDNENKDIRQCFLLATDRACRLLDIDIDVSATRPRKGAVHRLGGTAGGNHAAQRLRRLRQPLHHDGHPTAATAGLPPGVADAVDYHCLFHCRPCGRVPDIPMDSLRHEGRALGSAFAATPSLHAPHFLPRHLRDILAPLLRHFAGGIANPSALTQDMVALVSYSIDHSSLRVHAPYRHILCVVPGRLPSDQRPYRPQAPPVADSPCRPCHYVAYRYSEIAHQHRA